jgi:hypothetical protein
MRRYFAWYSDLDNDGTPETLRYSSVLWVPTVETPDAAGKARVQRIETLDGGVQVLAQARTGYTDYRSPAQFSLTWDTVPDDLRSLIEEDHARQRRITVQVDHRWRALEVTGSGLADLTAYVARGAWRYQGDTYYPDPPTYGADDPLTHVVDAGHTKLYAVASAGCFALGSTAGDLPTSAVLLATFTVANNRVTITSEITGVANARTARILDCTTRGIRSGDTGLTITLQEIA